MRIMTFDPGDNTGIVKYDKEKNTYEGISIYKDFITLEAQITEFKPDQIVVETFQLYPGKAKSMAWNTFYPCEVIGVINFMASKMGIPVVMQSASIKPYSKIDADCPKGNDHIKDAYRHLWYFIHMNKKKALN